MMRVLVTGANGFVGSTLCRKLFERGDSVRGLVRSTSDLALLDGVPIEYVVGALEDLPSLATATRDIDVIYHTAARVKDWGTLDAFRLVNVRGTQNVLEAAVCNRVRRFVYISSAAVHGFGSRDMDEDSPQPVTQFPYCQSKREAEALVMRYHRQSKIQTAIVRPGDLYGPGDRVVLVNLAGLLRSGYMAHIGGGDNLGAFTYVENLADGLILAGNVERAAGEVYVITDGVKLSWRVYFDKLTAALDFPQPRLSVPPRLAYGMACTFEGAYQVLGVQSRPPLTRYLVAHMSADYHFSIAKARRELAYEPRVGVDEGIQRAAEWYRTVERRGASSRN
jgi:nucleoside-diphosphate-sugar epimerase